jgi:SAM-dependent methyltransferase
MKMPRDSLRGRIREFLESHSRKLGSNILEVGSRIHVPEATWLNNKDLCPEGASWLGVDIQEGEGVDMVVDCENLPKEWDGKFTGILNSEVLEHTPHPHKMIEEMYRVLAPGGYLMLTTLLTHPIHGYPNDYWRFTSEGIKQLLLDAGFDQKLIYLEYGISTRIQFKVMEERLVTKDIPMQIFALAKK